ncbi:protein SOGA1-like isoform X2 [Nerophis ophidion]|uniref:protein SOGA1-like isoform X2 n=1 Tax=Nerophis ophidion TaxID=159077 RepID=UPI002AE032AF|nr:protein SOGA1-like isoform X2 [Nerophis ophidion]
MIGGGWRGRRRKLAATLPSVYPRAAVATDVAYHHQVAKSVSLRLYTELEGVQKKNSHLEWENEMLREKTQELEVAKHVLQAELEKARESCLKKRSFRSAPNKAERRLSQQMEDENDLKCQLHFAKEELAVMCKKLTKLVSDSEAMHEQLARYHSVYGDIEAAQSSEGKQRSAHAREAEVKVHLKLVEEEAMLLSRRIVELEVENRGLRAEMNDLRDKEGEVDDEGNRNVLEEHLSPSTLRRNRKQRCQRMRSVVHEKEQDEKASLMETSSLCSHESQPEGQIPSCHITREGPVGGEWDPSESVNNQTPDSDLKRMTANNFSALVALRDHACVFSSAIQLMMTPSKKGHCSSPSCVLTSPTDGSSNGLPPSQTLFFPGPLNEALKLLQAMLQTFITRMEVLVTDNNSSHKEGQDCYGDIRRKQECVQDLHAAELERPEQRVKGSPSKSDLVHSCKEPKMQLSMQILWILQQWCQEGKEAQVKTLTVLRGLLESLSAELQEETLDSKASVIPKAAAECAVNDERPSNADRLCSSIRQRLQRHLSPHACKRKDWCYLSQQAAQLDREDPVKTWDHLIMPLSFPDLNFEQMSTERSHTAPEKSNLRIYYSPPSKRRVQLAQLKQSSESDRESVDTQSPWCTPLTSFSSLCVGSLANLSDDMKEMAAGQRQVGHSSSLVQNRTRTVGQGVDVVCSGTQTQLTPQLVSVGLQTEGPLPTTLRNSPSRAVNSSLVSPRSRHISTSLDRLTSRTERPKLSTLSPKLCRSQSAFGASCTLSSSSASASRDRMSNGFHQSHSSLVLARQTSPRAAAGQNRSPHLCEPPCQSLKPPNKSAGGLVTEFLRRVSCRAEKTVPGSGQKTKSSLEGVSVRPSAASLSRSDSVTRIVNHRFMKQKEDVVAAQQKEKESTANNGVTHSLSSLMADDGSYDCSSSSTLTFCFARPFRSTPRQTSNRSKVLRHKDQKTASTAAESNCE